MLGIIKEALDVLEQELKEEEDEVDANEYEEVMFLAIFLKTYYRLSHQRSKRYKFDSHNMNIHHS